MFFKSINRIKYWFSYLPGSFYQYSGMGFLYWAAMSGTSFTTVYLLGLNYTALQIGTMSAAFTTIGIFAPPLWGVVSDKLRSVRKVFAICVFSSSVVWFLLPYSVRWFSPLAVLLVLPVFRFLSSPTMSLLDSWMVRHTNRDRRVGFGAIRMWGSIGWTAVAFAYGIILRNAPIDVIFYGYALFAIPCVVLALCIKEDDGVSGGADGTPRRTLSLREMQLGRIIKTKPLMAYFFFNLCIYIPVMASFTFLPFLLEATGGHSSFVGILSGFEALFEIPLLVLSAGLIKRFKPTRLIVFVGVLYTIEMTLFGFSYAPWHLIIVKCMHGVGYGLYLGCMVQYVYRLAPKGLTATAQTMISCGSAIAGITGSLIGGAVINTYGVHIFFRYSGLFMITVVAVYYIWLKKNGETGEGDGDDRVEFDADTAEGGGPVIAGADMPDSGGQAVAYADISDAGDQAAVYAEIPEGGGAS